MPQSPANMDKNIASLVEITEAILRGDFSHQKLTIDTEGLLSTLAQKINAMMTNLKTVEAPLTSAGQYAPTAVDQARNVVDLMAQSTDVVLDKADKLIDLLAVLETRLPATADDDTLETTLNKMKAAAYDIIASQSYQDAARQNMEKLIRELNQIRTWLLEALVVLNINRDTSPENIQKKTDLLREMAQPGDETPLKQNLVDDLMAEFGL
ncbi:MAG: hypothetical protein OEV73_00885 [Desulfobulbaceae bacterium]|nr:hypothetical protein [Desulfobulbaceae bacterium]